MQQVIQNWLWRALPAFPNYLAQIEKQFVLLLGGSGNDDCPEGFTFSRNQEVKDRFYACAENVFHVAIGERRDLTARAQQHGLESGRAEQFPGDGVGRDADDGQRAGGDRAFFVDLRQS